MQRRQQQQAVVYMGVRSVTSTQRLTLCEEQ